MSENGVSVQSAVPAAPMAVVEHREVLRSAMIEVENALAVPSFGRGGAWCAQVAGAARTLEGAFADHVHLTEAPDGLYNDLLSMAPRLAHRVTRLRNDHVEIMSGLTGFLNGLDAAVENIGSVDEAGVESWRVAGTGLLGLLVRHRQRGIDLTYEGYSDDLGGG